MNTLTERYARQIAGGLQCLDRVIITGTLPTICHAGGMTSFLFKQGIRIFDYTQFVEPLRDRIRKNAEQLAAEAGIEIDFIRRKNFRKEDRIQAILRKRGHHPGLVHIFSAMELCNAYKPWHDKKTHRTFLKPTGGKCLHYYFYFIDQRFGLCYMRVPTWCPFRLQFYFNGHSALARALDQYGIAYTLRDNAFVDIDGWDMAQKLADAFDVEQLQRTLDRYAAQFCPVNKDFDQRYHWSIMQAEYATDIVFKRMADLQPLYEHITRTAIHAVKPDHVATFLGRKLHPNYLGELGNHYHTRIEGTRIKHHMAGKASIKMYDKFGRILRIETTANDVSFFKHYRKVEHRDGTSSLKQAPMKKTIYSLPALMDLSRAANRRYVEFVSSIDDPNAGLKGVQKIAAPAETNGRSVRGFNLFHREDHRLFVAISRGEFTISGLTNRALRRVLSDKSGSQISRLLKRLRLHGLLKRVGRTYKYYLTKLGRRAIIAALKLRELVVIPAFADTAM
jgi:hypothetical protein